jgi:MscS family membrane protein
MERAIWSRRMSAMPARPWKIVLLVCGFVGAAPALLAQSAPIPQITARSPEECLASPRETLKTLYYAVVAYDVQPQLVDEAVACLDLDETRAIEPAEATRLAIDLESVLRILCVPLHGVPDKTDRETVDVLNDDVFKITLTRGTDKLWRFSRDTVERIPAMSRAALSRFRDLQAQRVGLKEDLTDPSATMRCFLINMFAHDFYAAARCLDLGTIDREQRDEKGPLLARQLAFIMQRRGWMYLQEVPNQPIGPAFTWYADKAGRIAVERLRLEDGKEAWLFNKKTVRNIPAMYEQVKNLPADPRYARLGAALEPLTTADGLGKHRPANVPPQLGSPRALLEGFFRTMDAAETQDSRLVDALEYLDLQGVPQADRRVQGIKVAGKLEAVLRKAHVELSALPADWNAPPQVLGENQGVRIEIVRGRDGCWRFSQFTVAQAPAFLDKLTVQDKAEHDRAAHLDCARDTMGTFLTCMRRGEYEQAADCLDLSSFQQATRNEVGPVLAFKLKFVMDRIGRVYIQEVPDTPDGPRYVFYRGELGRIVIARVADGPRKGSWLFTAETVALVEPMFRGVLLQPIPESNADSALPPVNFWRTPGVWVRFHMPRALHGTFWRFQYYQWLGLVLAVLIAGLVSRLLLAQLHRLLAVILHHCGSILTKRFVAAKLRPLTWVAGFCLLFQVLSLLDLPVRFLDGIVPIQTFGMAGLIGWLGVQLVDLATAVYMNSELIRPHRSLSDMVVPVSMRSLKGIILLGVAVYVVYQIGEGEYLNRFLTGLGVAGLAASLAAQDALKSFFSTLLLIGERSFKLGDRVKVGDLEGVVEQVGFRATRLRTPDGSLLTIPNSTIASAPISNLSTKALTHCKVSLRVNCDTAPERIQTLRERMREWLLEHPKVQADKTEVRIHPVTETSVEVGVEVYLADAGAESEKELTEEINGEVRRQCETIQAEAAERVRAA